MRCAPLSGASASISVVGFITCARIKPDMRCKI